MNGSALTKAFVPLPGGVTAVYNASGLQYFRHPDWLGSSRLATTTSRTKYYDVAYAPFGEPYAGSGTTDLSFTGQNQDTELGNVPGGAGGLYDFLYREHSPVQGRWLSPDPSGLAAVNPADPQSWNRYAYVGNRPLGTTDALGLDYFCNPDDPSCTDPCMWSDALGCIGGGGWGGGDGGGQGFGTSPGGNPPAPPQRTGGVWPGNETTGLPSVNPSPLELGDLFGLLPGCGGGSTAGVGFTTSTTTAPPTNPCFVLVIPAISALTLSSSGSNPSGKPPSSQIGVGFCEATPSFQLRHFPGCNYLCEFVYSSPFDWTIGDVYVKGGTIDRLCGPGSLCPRHVVVQKDHAGQLENVTLLSCLD